MTTLSAALCQEQLSLGDPGPHPANTLVTHISISSERDLTSFVQKHFLHNKGRWNTKKMNSLRRNSIRLVSI